MRHGRTELSPAPEGWSAAPLDADGCLDALAGAGYLKDLIDEGGWPAPDYIVCSDLVRAQETAAIAADVLAITDVTTMPELRAFGGDEGESVEEYEARRAAAPEKIFADDRLALAVGHRSTSAYLDLQFGGGHSDEADWQPDYRSHALLREGGLLGLAGDELIPIYRAIEENWPPEADPIDPDWPEPWQQLVLDHPECAAWVIHQHALWARALAALPAAREAGWTIDQAVNALGHGT